MAYVSIDKIQNVLANEVFEHTKDSKKAAGRCLGTFIEIITYYILKSWKLDNYMSIESGLAEYGNSEITHNVEFSLHPCCRVFETNQHDLSELTPSKLIKQLESDPSFPKLISKTSNKLIEKGVIRNAAKLGTTEDSMIIANTNPQQDKYLTTVVELRNQPFAMFECKRVGVEEGMKKGPQTIEKAKQGAYVARAVSSLQKVWSEKGEVNGVLFENGEIIIDDYDALLDRIIKSDNMNYLSRFTLTVGVVSNHGNWFTSENQNKEMKVLAQAYDWLLFLTDEGLCEFIDLFILNPTSEYQCVRDAFISSYGPDKTVNQFTKVRMNLDAHKCLVDFFTNNMERVEKWFNIITPNNSTLMDLQNSLQLLSKKKW